MSETPEQKLLRRAGTKLAIAVNSAFIEKGFRDPLDEDSDLADAQRDYWCAYCAAEEDNHIWLKDLVDKELQKLASEIEESDRA